MSFVVVMLLLIVALNSWKGTLSVLCSASDPTFSGEEWAATRGKIGSQETDTEKAAAPASPSSTIPVTPSVKGATPQLVSPPKGYKPFADVTPRSTKAEPAQAQGRTERWSHRQRHDSFRDSKAQRSRSKNLQPSSVPFPLTTNIPRPSRALRQTSPKTHHSQLTPLRTT